MQSCRSCGEQRIGITIGRITADNGQLRQSRPRSDMGECGLTQVNSQKIGYLHSDNNALRFGAGMFILCLCGQSKKTGKRRIDDNNIVVIDKGIFAGRGILAINQRELISAIGKNPPARNQKPGNAQSSIGITDQKPLNIRQCYRRRFAIIDGNMPNHAILKSLARIAGAHTQYNGCIIQTGGGGHHQKTIGYIPLLRFVNQSQTARQNAAANIKLHKRNTPQIAGIQGYRHIREVNKTQNIRLFKVVGNANSKRRSRLQLR